jgi:MFS transporter, FHS family, glucose/mannose:H+ symporter
VRPPGWLNASSLVLAAGFSFTGAGTVMLGVLLPVLAQEWGLGDDAAGFLFFLQFAGSSLGAVLTGLGRASALRRGYALLVVSSCALAFAGPRSAFVVFFFYGLGLGMAMTATSLLFSDRFHEDRAEKLEGLNFVWSAGAMAAPALFLPFAHNGQLRPLFIALQAVFLLLLGWALFRERNQRPLAQAARQRKDKRGSAGMVTALVMLAVGAVGVETALSSWLTTYVHRIAPAGGNDAKFFPVTLFYLGVVLSRLVCSTRILEKVGRMRMLQGLVWAIAAAVALLVALHAPALIDAAAGLAGLCIGPLYPLVLAFLLERTARGWIFAMGGVGSALFPWVMGVVSTHYGSLRYGLAVPLIAAAAMALLRTAYCRRGAGDFAMPPVTADVESTL